MFVVFQALAWKCGRAQPFGYFTYSLLSFAAMLGGLQFHRLVWWKMSTKEAQLAKSLQNRLPSEFRVKVTGCPSELRRFVKLRDVFFPVQTFRRIQPMFRIEPANAVFVIVLCLVVFVSLILSGRWLGVDGKIGVIVSSVAVATFALSLRGRGFYRICAGRLDILGLTPFGQLANEASIDLRQGQVEIDLTSRDGYITVHDPHRGSIVIERRTLFDPVGMAVAVAQAAVSTASAPSLPDDAFTD